MDTNNLQETILNSIEEGCNELTLSNKTIGNLIRSMHGSLPIIFLTLISCGSFKTAIITNIIVFILLISFVIFRGCILSKLEKKLCKEDFIITDPLFEIMEIEINNENRFKTLYYIGIPYILLINFIIYYRFFT
jgi:hypothetical protein